jgi:hypothetical protein
MDLKLVEIYINLYLLLLIRIDGKIQTRNCMIIKSMIPCQRTGWKFILIK